jgi:ribosomal protein S18 acetylase RimI-like enzyme
MDDHQRAFALMDRIDDGVAEQVAPTPHGDVIVDTRLFHVHDRNFLRAKQPGDASAGVLAAEAEAVQGAHPELRHRRVNARDESASARFEPGFVALGWEPQRFVVMAHRRDPDRAADRSVLEVEEPALRSLWAEGIRNEPHGKDERVVQQILAHHRSIRDVVPTRYFAARAGSRLVAHCELYSAGQTGQIENVVTLPRFRGRGLARALVLHALAESRAAGNDLTFLVADANDWPPKLYERLGFEIAGRYTRFLKRLPASPSRA